MYYLGVLNTFWLLEQFAKPWSIIISAEVLVQYMDFFLKFFVFIHVFMCVSM